MRGVKIAEPVVTVRNSIVRIAVFARTVQVECVKNAVIAKIVQG